MTTMAKAISVKDTAFGQDMLEVLAERQLEKVSYCGLDISRSILTLKEYLVKKLSHGSWKVDPRPLPAGTALSLPHLLRFRACSAGRVRSRVLPDWQDIYGGS